MATLDEIFDDANGDLAIGELESAVEKYRQCVERDPAFFDGWHESEDSFLGRESFEGVIARCARCCHPEPRRRRRTSQLLKRFRVAFSGDYESGGIVFCVT